MRLAPMRLLRIPLLVCVAVAACASCDRPIRSGALLDGYRAAACVMPTFAKGVEPPTRGWDSTIVVANDSKATIRGAQMVGGQVNARYEADGRDVVVVDPGDYIYPNDVRLNERRDRLYVKASGAAGGIWQETWLYEYDLVERRALRKSRVHPEALPPECRMPNK